MTSWPLEVKELLVKAEPADSTALQDGLSIPGEIKSAMGFRQFLLRRLEKVGLEWPLVCIAYNFKLLHLVGAGLNLAGQA